MTVEDDKDFIGSLHLATWKIDFVNSGGDSTAPIGPEFEDREPARFEDANAHSSVNRWTKHSGSKADHAVLLDLDSSRVALIPSATPCHFHLVIDAHARWEDYLELLRLLVRMGIIEEGYATLTEARGQAFLRMPGERKESGRLVEFEEPPEQGRLF